jgi:hypothetical protein
MLAGLFGLHDACLQPSNLAMTFDPINAVPMCRAIGGRTRAELLHSHLLFLLEWRFQAEVQQGG